MSQLWEIGTASIWFNFNIEDKIILAQDKKKQKNHIVTSDDFSRCCRQKKNLQKKKNFRKIAKVEEIFLPYDYLNLFFNKLST